MLRYLLFYLERIRERGGGEVRGHGRVEAAAGSEGVGEAAQVAWQ